MVSVGLVAFALLIAGPLLYYAVITTKAATNSILGILPFTLAFVALGFLIHLWRVVHTVTTLWSDRIETSDGIFRRCLAAHEIDSYSFDRNDWLYFFPKAEGARALIVFKAVWAERFQLDWLLILPNERDAGPKRLELAVTANPRFGATHFERQKFLSRMRRWAGGLNIAGVVAAASYLLWPVPQIALILVFIPLIAVGVSLWSAGVVQLDVEIEKRDPRPSAWAAALAPGLATVLVGFNGTEMLEPHAPFVPGICLAAGMIAALLWRDHWLRSKPLRAAFYFMIGATFMTGALHQTNIRLDSIEPTQFKATIVSKQSYNRRDSWYALELAPWGPNSAPKYLDVSREIFDVAAVGDEVCLRLHPGFLGWQWFERTECSTRGAGASLHAPVNGAAVRPTFS